MDKSFEQRIEEAIVARFFEPSWIMQSQATYGNDGMVNGSAVVTVPISSPMSVVAEAIYNASKDRIIAKVMATIDIDAIVAEWAPLIAKDVVTQLQKENDRWSANPGPQARKDMLEKVYNQVADEFGRQCVAHLKQTGGLMGILEAGTTDAE